MDFSTIDPAAAADEGADLHVCDPLGAPLYMGKDFSLNTDGQGEPCIIRVRGMESRALREAQKDYERRAARGQRGDPEAHGMRLLVVATVSWRNIPWNGELLECTPENVRMLYSGRDFVARQVANFSREPSNFFGNASTG